MPFSISAFGSAKHHYAHAILADKEQIESLCALYFDLKLCEWDATGFRIGCETDGLWQLCCSLQPGPPLWMAAEIG